jgi:predicted dehydrogenase
VPALCHVPIRLALVGCGAISELYYAPALQEACRHTSLEVVALCDPSSQRLESLQRSFPVARTATAFEEVLALRPDLAVVASPPRFHADQVTSLLAAGAHVLCEKPMASSVTEAEAMVAASRAADRVLAIGLFRRFFPALQSIQGLVSGGALGAPQSFCFSEGGAFNWPAASGSFFQKHHSQGGVLLDVGVHALDLVCWWFGEPDSLSYEDDAMGNLEANCRINLTYPNDLAGEVRLSRDTAMANRYAIQFERGEVTWAVGNGNHLHLRLNGLPVEWRSELWANNSPAATYHHSFVHQLQNFVAAARGTEAVLVSAEEGIRSLRLIDTCYRSRQLMAMPWLTQVETHRALALAEG